MTDQLPPPEGDDTTADRDADRAELAERFANQDATRAGAVDEVAATLDDSAVAHDQEISDELRAQLDAALGADRPTTPDPAVLALYRPPYQPGIVQLTLVVHIDPDGLWVEVPAFPDMFATGTTIPELGAALGEALEQYMIENTQIPTETTEGGSET